MKIWKYMFRREFN